MNDVKKTESMPSNKLGNSHAAKDEVRKVVLNSVCHLAVAALNNRVGVTINSAALAFVEIQNFVRRGFSIFFDILCQQQLHKGY